MPVPANDGNIGMIGPVEGYYQDESFFVSIQFFPRGLQEAASPQLPQVLWSQDSSKRNRPERARSASIASINSLLTLNSFANEWMENVPPCEMRSINFWSISHTPLQQAADLVD
jgi:hypothetical protein